jgi:microcystin-dependent protein
MSTPFIGEIRIFAFNFAPSGWAMCNGQLLSISQNTALFALLGTTYGGNGQTTFALPNLQGCVAIHQGAGFVMGQTGGEQSHTLTANEMPTHTHLVNANNNPANTDNPQGAFPADTAAAGGNSYSNALNAAMNPEMLSAAGGGQPHNNLQPYLVLNFCIALNGIFPSQN